MHIIFKLLIFVISGLFLSSCFGGSPENAFAVETQEHGQCVGPEKKAALFYKMRIVPYRCEDDYVLLNKPYEKENSWYFKSGYYNGKTVINMSETKVVGTLSGICSLKGSYGTGNKDIKRFYFNKTFKDCKPFSWSGENGTVPFKSQDECVMQCHYY